MQRDAPGRQTRDEEEAPVAGVIEVRQAVDQGRIGASLWLVVALLALVTFFDGYDVFAPAYVIPYAVKAWGLRPSQAGLLVSSGLIGFMIGSLANGPIADRIGRKPTLTGALGVAAVLTLATALLARSYWSFLALRLLTGVGLGMLLPLAVTLVNEMAPRRATNRLVGVVMAGWSTGGVAAPLAGATLGRTYGWPALFWIGGPAVLFAALAVALLRESPRFLAAADRQGEAGAVMRWLLPERAGDFAGARFTVEEKGAERGAFRRLLAPEVRSATLVLWLCSACSLFVIFGLSGWVPQAMIQKGESFGASFGFGALLQFAAVLGGLGCGWLADRGGPRPVLVAAWTGGALAVAGLALVNQHWANLAFVAVAGFCVMGAQPVLNTLAASLYPTEIRGTGVGAELGVGRLGGILGPYAGGWLQELAPGSAGLFSAMAVAAALSVAAMALFRPGRRAV